MKLIKVLSLKFLIVFGSLAPFYSHAQSLNLSDIGMKTDLQKDLETQKLLEQRRYDLEQHQLWGLVAVAGLAMTLGSAEDGKLNPEHALWAGITAGSYGAAAYYALSTPSIPGSKYKGQTQWHKYLTWVHLPAMILTPLAGVQAAKQRDEGKPLSGLAKQHKNLAGIAATSLALSVLLVSFEF